MTSFLPMDDYTSYIANSPASKKIWDELFRNMSFLKTCFDKQIFFTVIGDIESEPPPGCEGRYLALIVTNDDYQLTGSAFNLFLSSLKPHGKMNDRYELDFTDSDITLNIYNLAYMPLHKSVVIAECSRLVRDYYKSGIIPVLSISANTFGIEGSDNADYVCPGPITHRSSGPGYILELTIGERKRKFDIVSAIMDLWM